MSATIYEEDGVGATLSVAALAHEIRDYVNTPRVRTRLYRDDAQFWQALSALDLLGDTSAAIMAHARGADATTDRDGDRYLRLYGLMTAFQLQQDAGTNLAKALDRVRSSFDYVDLATVRDARIAAAGHSSRRDRQVPEPTFYFIYRNSLSTGGFEMGVASANGGYRTEVINLEYLKYLQERGMTAFLNDVLTAVRREEVEHRRQFMGRSLAALIDGHSYEFEKVSSTGLGGSPDTTMAPASVRILREDLLAFEAELKERG